MFLTPHSRTIEICGSAPISRRSLLAGLGGVVVCASLGSSFLYSAVGHARARLPTRPVDRAFQISWRGKPIGTHRVSIRPDRDAGSWRLESAIDVRVKVFLLGELVYKYQGVELWRNGRILELASETTDGRRNFSVSGRADGNDFDMNGPAGPYIARGSLLTTNSLWTEAVCAQGELIDANNGGVIGLVAKEKRVKTVSTKSGRVTARAYDVISPLVAGEFWYDSDGVWVGGRIERSGQKIDYHA